MAEEWFIYDRGRLHERIKIQKNISANICWSSRRLDKTFSEDVLYLEHVLKTSWKTKNCYAEDVLVRRVLKTSWRYILKTSSRRLADKKNVYWGYLYLTKLNAYIFDLTKSLFNKPISDKSKANPKCIN